MVFTGSHGMCFFSGDDRQDREQGAIVCGDWPGVDPPKRSQYCAARTCPRTLTSTDDSRDVQLLWRGLAAARLRIRACCSGIIWWGRNRAWRGC